MRCTVALGRPQVSIRSAGRRGWSAPATASRILSTRIERDCVGNSFSLLTGSSQQHRRQPERDLRERDQQADAEHLQDHELQHADIDLSRSEEHTSELQSLMRISYAVFCLKKHK